MMEKIVKVSKSFQECDRADKEYYHSLTPLKRLEILLELNNRLRATDDGGHSERLERVYRIIKLS
jgi:hypothetical protein